MTTEIAILNRSAVALAADSAASVQTGGGIKVYDGVNKLFELVKGRPVGVMIYNAAELSFRPWETIIKTYREERQDVCFGTLDEYVTDFRAFLRDHKQLFSTRQQAEALTQSVSADLIALRTQVAGSIQAAIQGGQAPTTADVTAMVAGAIQQYSAWPGANFPLEGWSEKLPTTRTLATRLRPELDLAIDAVFQNLPLTTPSRAALRTAMVRRAFGFNLADGQFSGVVLAGFGDDEYYPRLREFRTKAVYGGHLLSYDVQESRTDISVNVAGDIKSFAQGDMIRSFTDGIQDQVRSEMIRFWDEWQTQGVGQAVATDKRLQHLPEADRLAIADSVNDLSRNAVTSFFNSMAEHEQVNVRGPLLQSVSFLPKDELGAMAESLVNLTTLKRRVSLNEAQTVGGPVDVAVVSRGDGFVWLKRKHYFNSELNPSWARTHSAQQAVRKEASHE